MSDQAYVQNVPLRHFWILLGVLFNLVIKDELSLDCTWLVRLYRTLGFLILLGSALKLETVSAS